ncbi:DUF1622 domain-containing protein [Paracoccus sp. S-4012]|uniref:DUF1622 domain-containing protein n=1 Tax=Paracoccus sp. S-4012 TaxID=2665648 RepID=UPI0012B021B0|nr:DUF1622 domain-containing protein [Paracoccus sp. S-4012]MRX50324.1 DUF1622 domain-containing protein [Paracoccus sp. S-4012]
MERETTGFFDYVREGSILHQRFDWLVEALEWAATGINLFAVAVLLVGALRFVAGFLKAEIGGPEARVRGVNAARIGLGRYILAGLEILIVADIIHTAISLAMADLVFLGLLVVVRSVISFFLERELEGVRRSLERGPDEGAETERRVAGGGG